MTTETQPDTDDQKPAEEGAKPAEATAVAEPPKKTKAQLRDEQLAEVESELDDAFSREIDARRDVISLSSELKDAKDRHKGIRSEVYELLFERREIKEGRLTRQPTLFKKPRKEKKAKGGQAEDTADVPAGEDPADSAPLSALVEFGVTSKQIETLEDSQLGKEQPLKTVGDLFRAIAADNHWYSKIKGFGESKRDGLINATIAYREKFPVPDGDTRQKQCKDCDTLYPQSGTECPSCQSKFFVLTELEAAEQVDPAPAEPTEPQEASSE